MKNGALIAIGLCLAAAWPLLPSGDGKDIAPEDKWVARYNGPANSTDWPRGLALDSAGNVYVTGYSEHSSINGKFVTIKYSTAGRQLWVRRYAGPVSSGGRCIAVDSAGNACVAGTIFHGGNNTDFVTIKYSPNGGQVWVRKYAGPRGEGDGPLAMALDAADNVYVTGHIMNAESRATDDYATIKYDKNGRRLWVKTYNGPGNGYDIARSIAVDKAGNAYVTGDSFGRGGQADIATVKYASDGEELWVKRYNGPANGDDGGYDLAADGSGCLFVTGRSTGPEHELDFATLKYNRSGGLLWRRTYTRTSESKEYPLALAVDDAGHVVVAGSTRSGAFQDFSDYATVKYDADGSELWVKRYSGPVGIGEDVATDIAMDGSGNIYVTGHSRGSDSSLDFATIKYNANGRRIWVKRYNGPGNQEDEAKAIAVDSAGNVYVTGQSKGAGTGWDFATIKY